MQAGLMLPGSVRGDSRREREEEGGRERGGEKDYKLVAKDSSLYSNVYNYIVYTVMMRLF